jgi:hypothetical protein
MSAPVCGAQQPGTLPSPFDWGALAAVGGAATATGIAFGIAKALLPTLGGQVTLTGAAAGAGAILVLVFYYAFQADGCIISPSKREPICLSGIVEDTADTSNTAVAVLAPFAMGPAGLFDLVVKSAYWMYVTQNSFWVYCSPVGAAMLPCIIKSKTACGGKIGSVVGAIVGAAAGTALGYFAGVAVGGALACTASLIFYLLCLLIALIVAAIVAAAVTYVAADVGGWIGEGIAATGSDPLCDDFKSVEAGSIVTVRGDWVTDKDVGNNELFYTTSIQRNGKFGSPPPYSTDDADSTPADDCPIAPPAPK